MGKIGYKHTPETRAKLVAAWKNRPPASAETRAKISAANSGEGNPRWGKKQSLETRLKISEKMKKRIMGEGNPRWNGGRYVTSSGYVYLVSPEHPFRDCRGYVAEHRLVMEAWVGRTLSPEETVHHINGIVDDNRIENLMRFDSQSDHTRWHAKERKGNAICGENRTGQT